MKFEFSAGGIVCKKEKAKSKEQKDPSTSSGLMILLCQHSYHHGWGFPKGLIGDGSAGSPRAKESKEEAAIREVKEETGADGKILEALEPVTYWYKFNNEKIKKTVYYFVMEYVGGDITKHDFEMEDVRWVEKEKVLEKLTYKSDKEIFKKALPIIERLVVSV